jgi:hypothetical protein
MSTELDDLIAELTGGEVSSRDFLDKRPSSLVAKKSADFNEALDDLLKGASSFTPPEDDYPPLPSGTVMSAAAHSKTMTTSPASVSVTEKSANISVAPGGTFTLSRESRSVTASDTSSPKPSPAAIKITETTEVSVKTNSDSPMPARSSYAASAFSASAASTTYTGSSGLQLRSLQEANTISESTDFLMAIQAIMRGINRLEPKVCVSLANDLGVVCS